MSKGGGGGSTTTVQKADPWAELQGPLKQLYGSALNWFNSSNPQYFPGQTIAGQAPETAQALAMGKQRALQGNSGTNLAQQQNNATIQGQYLGSNPFLDSMFKNATQGISNQYSRSIAPAIASQFSAAGRFGSGLHSQAIADAAQPLAQGLSNAASSIYGGAYDQERNRQQRATEYAPQLAAQDYLDVERLLGIGQYRQQTAQERLNADIQRYDFGQNTPANKLQQLNALLQGGQAYAGRTTQQDMTRASNPFAGAVGGASLASGVGTALGSSSTLGSFLGGPWGALTGAVLGGLFN